LFMAQRLGISQKTYSYMERGTSKPDIIELIKIANLTGIHPMQFLEKTFEGEPAWESNSISEANLLSQVQKLEKEIIFLKSQNLFLSKSIAKLLNMSEV